MTDFTKYKKCFGQCKWVREHDELEGHFLGECASCRLRGLCRLETPIY